MMPHKGAQKNRKTEEKIMFIKKTVRSAWDVIMDESKNPLRNLPIQTAHMLMQLLAWMWSTIFSLAIGSYVVFGVTAVGHLLIIAGIFVTLVVFRNADTNSRKKAVDHLTSRYWQNG
jgi:hypothetical protein